MKKPKILILSFHFPPSTGGIENYLYNLLSHIPNKIGMITFRVPGWQDFDQKKLVLIKRLHPGIGPILSSPFLFRMMLIPLNIIFFLSCWKEITGGRYNIIVSGSADTSPAASWLSDRFNIPFVAITYGKDVVFRGRQGLWKRLFVYPALHRADAIITISRFTREILTRAGINPRNITLIPPGIDPQKLTPYPEGVDLLNKKYQLKGKPVILTVGRLVARKGHQKVIGIMPELLKKFPGLVYLIVGEGPQKKNLLNQVEELNLVNHVIFTGAVSPEMLNACYQRCQVMVMPSRSEKGDVEGYGIVYLEAGFFSKPVIGAKEGGITDAVEDGVTGILIDPDDDNALMQAILKLLNDPVLAAALGKAGREKARGQTWTKKSKYFYEKLINLVPVI